MNLCWQHVYSGVLPCPWPDCPSGTATSSFELHGKWIRRKRFGDAVDAPVHAWVIDGVNAAHVVAQLTRRAIAELNGAASLADDGSMYHFTSAVGARGILKSAELWLTDYRDLRDGAEVRDGQQVARATFEDLRAELHSETSRLLDGLVAAPLPDGVYVACFCMLQQSPYHWQEYASDSAGAALVLNPVGFETLLESDPFAVQLTRVAYTWDVKAGLFAHLAIWLDELLRFDIARNTFDENAYSRELTQIFGELLPMCKDVSFFREHEIRLFASPALSRFGLASRLTVRDMNGRRYISTSQILPEFALPVEKVLLGPNFEGDGRDLGVALVQRVVA